MLSPSTLMPHAVCWRQDTHLIWTMVASNAVTALSYLTVCLTLLYLVRHTRRVLASDWAYFAVGFALFIVACGTTHVMEVVTTWWPYFWIDAWANILTAVLSATVAIALMQRVHFVGDSINDYAARLADTETDQRKMRESLMDAQKLSEWSRMSSIVAHEIAGPLEAIQNLLYLVQTSGGVNAESAAWAGLAAEEAARVLTISRSAMDFFRQGKDAEMIDLYAAAESVRVLLQPLMDSRHVDLQFAATGDMNVCAFPGEPRQVMLNLIRNAVEATPIGGSAVRVLLHGREDEVEITVADTGSGISPELLPQLFTLGLTTKGEHGNGLGLWSVRQIINRHGGDVHADSSPGQGTQFTLHWPRK